MSWQDTKTHQEHLAWLARIVADLQATGWYGTITVKVENGLVRRLTKEESVLPPATSGRKSPRGSRS